MTWGTPVPAQRRRALSRGVVPKESALRLGRIAHACRDGSRPRVGGADVYRRAVIHAYRRTGLIRWQGHTENAAQFAGFHTGDQIVSIDGTAINGIDQLTNLLHGSTGKHLTIVVDRDGAISRCT